MVVVEAGVRKLKAEIVKEDSLLIEQIDYVRDSYACDTGEYELALASEERRKTLTGDLQRNLESSGSTSSKSTRLDFNLNVREFVFFLVIKCKK
ncbi:hypothetical protein AQUCO_00800172v1 [Aquilegia coerulea]|uniref:Uncharacterized protein n=1 Tax=Aquilegia coerulea TaxID=218851 RepID=A0A2G5EHQ1_AQUCA|nr:hypothetical protein AQUCO_00800172v1 [Aquilegia coerulea]